MKRVISAVFIAVAIALTASAQAKDAKAIATTVTGELVDTGCYLAHGDRGTVNADCGAKCVNQGMPMGVLTPKGVLYLVTLSHQSPDPYNKLKSLVGKNVSITGAIHQRAGLKAIEVMSAKPAA